MAAQRYTIGLDIGSSSIKAALVNVESGKAISNSKFPKTEMEIHAPHKDWAEQSPEFWWECTHKAIQEVCQKSKIPPSEISAIGIAYQMHGLVTIDKDGAVIRPSIIWCDSRATSIGNHSSGALTPKDRQSLLNSYGNFTASKLGWVKTHEPESFEKIDKFLLPGDYIAYKFSGNPQTTIGGLSEGIFWDFNNIEIAKSTRKIFGFEDALFPKVVPTIGYQCEVNQTASDITGIPAGTPITYRAGDQPNNALSLGVFENGEVAATGGTSGVVYAVTDQLVFDPTERINAFAHVNYTPTKRRIGLLMCINGTGIQYAWLRKLLAPDASYEALEEIAQSASIGSRGLITLPFGNGAERIFQNRPIGAHLSNIDFNRHSLPDIIRAGLEGIAFTFNYGLRCLKDMGCQPNSLKVGNDNLFQSKVFSKTLANLSGCNIEVYRTSGAEGAGRAAAVGANLGPGFDTYQKKLEKVEVYEPDSSWDESKECYSNWEIQLKKHIQID